MFPRNTDAASYLDTFDAHVLLVKRMGKYQEIPENSTYSPDSEGKFVVYIWGLQWETKLVFCCREGKSLGGCGREKVGLFSLCNRRGWGKCLFLCTSTGNVFVYTFICGTGKGKVFLSGCGDGILSPGIGKGEIYEK